MAEFSYRYLGIFLRFGVTFDPVPFM